MRRGEIDVLVGTQMVTKGHDLPNVTLVGVLNADAALAMPDFRAAERTFQLLVQVAGRAGRGQRPGRVLIQTHQPHHSAIALAAKHDTKGFAEAELAARRELHYPPFSRVALVRFDAVDEAIAREAARKPRERRTKMGGGYRRNPRPRAGSARAPAQSISLPISRALRRSNAAPHRPPRRRALARRSPRAHGDRRGPGEHVVSPIAFD